MNYKRYKSCAVPQCKNTTVKTPEKLFVYVPENKAVRYKWLALARRDATTILPKTHLYFCEDHFDMPNDMENYMQYSLMGHVSQIRMKPGCLPTKYHCQLDRSKRTSVPTERSYISKKRKKALIEECEKTLQEQIVATKHVEVEEPMVNAVSTDVDKEECRTCLKMVERSKLKYMFELTEEHETTDNIAEELCKLARVQIKITDPHSNFICMLCYKKLLNTCKFIDMVQWSQFMLKKRHKSVSNNERCVNRDTQNYDTVEISDMKIHFTENEQTDMVPEETVTLLDIKIEDEELLKINAESNGIEIVEQTNDEIRLGNELGNDSFEMEEKLSERLPKYKSFKIHVNGKTQVKGRPLPVMMMHDDMAKAGKPNSLKEEYTSDDDVQFTNEIHKDSETGFSIHETYECCGCQDQFDSYELLTQHTHTCVTMVCVDMKE